MAGIYLHIPFCKQACSYCDFHFSTQLKNKEILVHALAKEIELRYHELPSKKLSSIYFGGVPTRERPTAAARPPRGGDTRLRG